MSFREELETMSREELIEMVIDLDNYVLTLKEENETLKKKKR